MSRDEWTAVDAYFEGLLVEEDDVLAAAVRASVDAGLPDHQVSPAQGKLLQLFARMQQARRILEIGTLGGYSTIWMARALPAGGQLITLEADPDAAAVARANFERAGLTENVTLHLGPALETLSRLGEAEAAGFDLVFIDADKPNNPEYLDWAIRLSREGALIIADNVVRDGAVVEGESVDPRVQGVRRMNERIAEDPRLDATALQTVGRKGWDGFALIRVGGEEAQPGPRRP